MKNFLLSLSLIAVAVGVAAAQGKGVDTQNKEIRDIGNGRGPAENGTRKDVGTGRGIDFGKGKTPNRVPLANPYRMTARRDVLIAMVSGLMNERGLVLDENASRANEGVLIAQPKEFAKGAVLAQSELQRYANLPDSGDSAWTRGRYTLTVEVQSIDGTNNNVSVSAKVEGRSQSATAAQWLTLTSSGAAENEFLAALVERATGTDPYAVPKIGENSEKNDNADKPKNKAKDNPQF